MMMGHTSSSTTTTTTTNNMSTNMLRTCTSPTHDASYATSNAYAATYDGHARHATNAQPSCYGNAISLSYVNELNGYDESTKNDDATNANGPA